MVSGEVVAGEYVIKACQRHLDDLAAGEFVWDAQRAERAIDFFPRYLRHQSGSAFSGNPFVLSDWQAFIVGSIFGWLRKNGLRRFREAYIEIARKNGKSTLAAGIALLMLIADGEAGAEVYTAATKEDQAKIVWETARRMVLKSRILKRVVRVLRNTIHFDQLFGVFRPLGRDSKTLDGLSPSCVILDEFHKQPNAELYNVLMSALGSRQQPLFFEITTAGNNRNCICYRRRQAGINVLNSGLTGVSDPRLFVFIATLDEGDDPFDEAVWQKANPELGKGKLLDEMRAEASKAKLTPEYENNFLTTQLNIWIESATVWLPLRRWDVCKREIDWDDFRGRKCWGGLDLSGSTDFNAFVWVFEEASNYLVLPRLFLPERTLRDNLKLRDKGVLYSLQQWAKAGLIELTPGDWIDHDLIEKRLCEDAKRFQVAEVGYDPYNAGNLPIHLEDNGIRCAAIGQHFKYMNPAARELERRILSERIQHDGNPVIRWMLGNVVMRQDPNGNIRPDKDKSHEKIDGVVAMLMAINRVMDSDNSGESVYESRGLIELGDD